MAAAYIGLPLLVLWGFFRSNWAPKTLKIVVGSILAVLVLLVLGRLQMLNQPHSEQAALLPSQPILLTVTQPGLLPYPLGSGKIEQVRYDTLHLLVVSGILPDGNLLRASFHPHATLSEDIVVTAQRQMATQATGSFHYQSDSAFVTGKFDCVLPSGKALHCSFARTGVKLQ
jgi:hypothetical protein